MSEKQISICDAGMDSSRRRLKKEKDDCDIAVTADPSRTNIKPYKVLDAPGLQDDFYLNLVDWSSTNLLGVGLGNCAYIWNGYTSEVTKVCELTERIPSKLISDPDYLRCEDDKDLYEDWYNPKEKVTSVSWAENANHLAVGCEKGSVQIYDVTANKLIKTLIGHADRVCALVWNQDILASGSKDGSILLRDLRTPCIVPDRKLEAHEKEVCGLKWSPDKQFLASGGDDNKLFIWNMHDSQPYQAYHEHEAAVKAIAWSPHHRGLLASGGGTKDQKIRFWDTTTGQCLHVIDAKSQVTDMAWSKHSPELVTAHGYPHNYILIWDYPSLEPVVKLTGHNWRVTKLAVSPDGESIVSGAGDETLRFWKVFPNIQSKKGSTLSSLRSKL